MLPVPLRESSSAAIFRAELKKTLIIIFLCLIITVLPFRQCPALSALVACCLGLLAKLHLYFLVFFFFNQGICSI